jgi:hypothetical protein
MTIKKQLKDYVIKITLGNSTVPRGLYDSREYFRQYGAIHFKHIKSDDHLIAKSTNFRWGTIITEGKNEKELDKNVKDAILTAFEIPSSYAKEAGIEKVGSIKKKEYAIAK